MPPVLTFLFTDIEGSSQLWDRKAEAMSKAHQQHHQILQTAIEGQGGSIVKDRGDGFMAVFDDPVAALVAAAEGQRRVAAADWSNLGQPLAVRIGIHTGSAELRDGDYYGSDVNIAARLEGLANGGQVLVSDATRALTSRNLSSGLSTRELGRQRLKGIGQPEMVHQLVIAGLDSEFPPLSGGAVGQPLPEYAGTLFGREVDIENVVGLYQGGTRLVTLLGPGGIGKTRLAVEAARRMSTQSATYFADMAPIRASSEIGPTFADALGIHVEGTVDPFDLVADRISEPTVTVIDNLEHLSEVGPHISRLLSRCPSISLIATSRSPLRIRDETVVPVSPLAIGINGSSAAVDLFYERAATLGVHLTEAELPSVRSLCERVDGLPLAIELVAAQTRLLSVAEIDQMLQVSLDALGRGGDDRPDRHRTIRDTIEWSLGALDERQRSIFTQLSVFPAGPTLDQLGFVRDESPGELLDDLTVLTDNSLVNPHTGLAGGTRFRQLALLREYGAELASHSGESDELMSKLVDYYLERAETLQAGLLSQNVTSRELANDHANLVAAMQWSLSHGRAGEMADFLADIWIYWFNGDRTETVAEFIRAADGSVNTPKFHWLAGFVLGFQLGDFEAAAVRMLEAENGFAKSGDTYWVAMSRLWRGTAEPDPEVSRRLLETAYEELAHHHWPPAVRPLALLFLSMADVRAGDLEAALERRLAANDLAQASGHLELKAWLPWNIAVTLLFMDRVEEAKAQLPAAFEFMADDGYQEGIASFAHVVGVIAILEGNVEKGLEIIGASNAIMDRIGVATWGEAAILLENAVTAAEEAVGKETANSILESSRETHLLDLVDTVRSVLAEPDTGS
jgi:predicted ATPase/class 3 adenylate cyclase